MLSADWPLNLRWQCAAYFVLAVRALITAFLVFSPGAVTRRRRGTDSPISTCHLPARTHRRLCHKMDSLRV
jgi:hypothetical protein